MTDFTLDVNKHINYAIRNFNFKDVQSKMALMNWKWYLHDNTYRTPTVEEMRTTATYLLKDLCNSDFTNVSSGGFVATKCDDYLELSFVLSEVSTDHINAGIKYERAKKSKERIKKLEKINEVNN